MCSANRKAPHPAPALELYRSEFYRLGRSFAWQFEPVVIYVLSAEHGLVHAETELLPYSMTMSALGQDGGAAQIVSQLKEKRDPARYRIVVLGLRKFVEPILQLLPEAEAPLMGMSMPTALQFLREKG